MHKGLFFVRSRTNISASMDAPPASSASTHAACPLLAAKCSGARPCACCLKRGEKTAAPAFTSSLGTRQRQKPQKRSSGVLAVCGERRDSDKYAHLVSLIQRRPRSEEDCNARGRAGAGGPVESRLAVLQSAGGEGQAIQWIEQSP